MRTMRVVTTALALGAATAMIAIATVAPSAVAGSHPQRAPAKPGPGIIVDGLFEEPNLLNPAAGPGEVFSGIVMTSLFANLYSIPPDGKITPQIATSLPTITDGGKLYTFTLRHTEWNNGTPFTANDVVATWHLITSKGFVAASLSGWSDIKAIHVLNPYKFTILLDKPFQPLVADCFATDYPTIVPAQVFAHLTGKAANTASYDHNPSISNGPFEFKSWVPGVSITVVPNPHWFGPKPKAKEIVFEVVPNENSLLADAQAHSINVFYFDPIEDVKQLAAIPGATVHFWAQDSWEGIMLNLRDPFLRNVKVRQAMEMAINRQELISKVWGGRALPLAADQTKVSWAYNPALKPWPYDPAEAKKLLAQAGFKMGANGYLEKGGKEFVLTYSTTAGDPWRTLDQELVQYWFKQIGIKTVIKDLPANAFFGTFLPAGTGWQMAEFEDLSGFDPEAGMVDTFQTGGVLNDGKFSNAQVDRLLLKADYQTTQAARAATLKAVEAIIHQQLPILFLYSPEGIATSINMTGYVPDPWMEDTWNCYDWAPKA